MSAVRIETSEHIATITIAPAEGRYDAALMDRLAGVVEAAQDDESVRVVVLRSEGDFGLGWAGDPDPTGIEALAALPVPVVAALRGGALSAGLELALACDVRVAAEDARFGLPETQTGRVPRAGGTQRLPRAVGRAHALRLILLGEEIDAAEARRIGLVSSVVPSSDLDGAARVIAVAIAAKGPLATRLAKEAVLRGTEMPLDQALRYELDLTIILQSTADRAEGVQAFVEKRPPNFTGR